jgi:hypothetical protein
MRSYLISLLASLTLVSCGGGNDVASTGASAVSAAAPATTTATPTTTEPKVNGQVDERTGVAPVAAQITVALAGEVSSCGSIPIVYARSGAYYSKLNQCRSSYEVLKAPQPGQTGIGMMCIVLPPPEPVAGAVGACQVGMIQTVIAALPVFDPTANGGCLNSSSYGGSGPALSAAWQSACNNALFNATTNPQCNALGGNWQDQSECNYSAYANGGCAKSSSFGGSGPALNAAQQYACGEALTYASNTSECSQLGGNYVTQHGSAGGTWSYCDGGAAGLKGGLGGNS